MRESTLPICPGAVQLSFKGVAAFMRGVVYFKSLYNVRPKHPILNLGTGPYIVADQSGATFSKKGFNPWPDLRVDRNHLILADLDFGSALYRPGLKVYIFRFQV